MKYRNLSATLRKLVACYSLKITLKYNVAKTKKKTKNSCFYQKHDEIDWAKSV